ncbi:hypothetical protein F2Q70_00003632 [Brassica cretica]|uniref:Uncharacterized protein n=2 Tax=Brassica cretica TaxID=69181 RepID=A0A3N6RM18_BRACR|nr:hypothetical protein F2Q68_00021019 [Brassica cretica]KAF2574943.1 hypothetical protein F2Q70_00003632 [Brassica cretica]KAF3566547.1 hypothetical protein DY000_02015532 [Brassica cretica]
MDDIPESTSPPDILTTSQLLNLSVHYGVFIRLLPLVVVTDDSNDGASLNGMKAKLNNVKELVLTTNNCNC